VYDYDSVLIIHRVNLFFL